MPRSYARPTGTARSADPFPKPAGQCFVSRGGRVVGGGSCLVIGDGWIGAARQEQVDGPLVAVLSGRHQRREAARLGFVGTRPCIQEQLQASEAGFRLRAGRRRVQRLIVEPH